MSSDSDARKLKPAKTATNELVPSLWSARAIPHVPQSGDPYALIGDCYERIPVAEEWELPDP